MFFKSSQRNLKFFLEKEAWDDIRNMLTTPKGKGDARHKLYRDPVSGNEITFLHLACWKHAPLDVIKSICAVDSCLISTLSETGADLPLHYAVASGVATTVEYLVSRYPQGVAVRCHRNGAFGNNVTPLHVAVKVNASPDTIRRLLEHAPQRTRTLRNNDGKTPFVAAMESYETRNEHDRQVVLQLLRPKTTRHTSAILVLLLATALLGWKSLSTWTRLWSNTVWCFSIFLGLVVLLPFHGLVVLLPSFGFIVWLQRRVLLQYQPIRCISNVLDVIISIEAKKHRSRLSSGDSTSSTSALSVTST